MFVFVSTHAIPAWYGVMQHTQEDGTTINYRIMGDEHGHMLVTLDGYALVMDGQSLCYAEKGNEEENENEILNRKDKIWN